MPTRVLIVDDHAGFRSVARELLASEGLDVVGEADGGGAAWAAACELRPEIVLIDVHLGDADGFVVAAGLAALPDPPVVVLTSSHDAGEFADRLPGAAAGFIPKRQLSAEAIRRLAGCPRR